MSARTRVEAWAAACDGQERDDLRAVLDECRQLEGDIVRAMVERDAAQAALHDLRADMARGPDEPGGSHILRSVDRAWTKEREELKDALRVRGDRLGQVLAENVSLRAERDRLAAALAELRGGVTRVVYLALHDSDEDTEWSDELEEAARRARAVLAATPADLATARDARVRAEGDAAALYDSRAEWSRRTFGEGDRYKGVIEHIRRELVEIERDPADLEEWVDVAMLTMDGAWRSAGADGAAFWSAFRAKAAKNEARKWAPPDAAGVVEHVRSEAERIERGGR